MKNVLIINQSSELYGADKALLELLENFPQGYVPIVVLEHEGPLKEILLQKNIRVIKCPVIKLNRASMSLSGGWRLFRHFFKGLYILRKETRNSEIDLVHSNAISVLVGAFYSFFFRKKHLWHVHEIVESPAVIAKLYPKLISFFAHRIIFNSKASLDQFLKIKPSIASKSEIVYNGQSRLVPISSDHEIARIKTNLFGAKPSDKIIGLVGRISRWKGQYLLLDAFSKLAPKHPDAHLVFVGSAPPDQDHFLHRLEEMIAQYQLQQRVSVVDFQKNIWPVYDAIDISVVPSIEPEPFGLVATEAMLSANPVIASAHGGLTEIVVDGQTGFLVPPRDEAALAQKIELLLQQPGRATQMGLAGLERVASHFSTASYVQGIGKNYELTLG